MACAYLPRRWSLAVGDLLDRTTWRGFVNVKYVLAHLFSMKATEPDDAYNNFIVKLSDTKPIKLRKGQQSIEIVAVAGGIFAKYKRWS